MKKNFSFLIFLLIILFYCYCFAQQEEASGSKDTAYRFLGIVPPVEYNYNIDVIYNNSLVPQFPDEALFDKNPSTIWLRTELLLSNKPENYSSDEINTHFTSPLYQQYLKDSEFNMVRYILGTIQAGAVGYMAYRHIKKYGFWK